MTLTEAKRYIINNLEHVSDSANFEAVEILIFATGISRNDLIFYGKEELRDSQLRKVKRLISKRKKGIPLQYLLGQWGFYSLDFKVGPGVLIPRPDTEILVDTALEYLSEGQPSQRIFDLCAGSGAIGISIAHNRPLDEITLVEKSRKAFKYLKLNNLANSTGCKTVLADVFSWCPGEKCDLLVCNPPYIRTAEISALSKEVKREPEMALDGGNDGLDFYRKITARADELIKPGGRIMYEIGFDEADMVSEILKLAGFSNIEVIKDYGGNDRVVLGDFRP